MQPFKSFEEAIAELFRNAGAERVESDVEVGGRQIDVLVAFWQMGIEFRVAVECKYYERAVGVDLVMEFAKTLDHLREAGLVDTGSMVSKSGFTQKAKNLAKTRRVHLLNPSDILSLSFRGLWTQVGLRFDTFSVLHAIEGISNDRVEQFLGLVGRVSKARKLVPAVDKASLWDSVKKCRDLAESLGDIYRAEAMLLEGILIYDEQKYQSASIRFSITHDIAKRSQALHVSAAAKLWTARCLTGMKKYAEALDALDLMIEEYKSNQALTALLVKAKYWRAKTLLLKWMEVGDAEIAASITNQFTQILVEADSQGMANYREGAKARLGDIAFHQGNFAESLRLYLEAFHNTPVRDAQDREKLVSLIKAARDKLSPVDAAAIERKGDSTPSAAGWPSMNTQICQFAIWRFARFPLSSILPRVLGDQAFGGVRDLLEDDNFLDFCIEADRYDKSKPGEPIPTGERKYRSLRAKILAGRHSSSDVLRRLRFVKRLLLGGALVNDTGRNGGVALVGLDASAESRVLDRRQGEHVIPGNGGLRFRFDSRKRLAQNSEFLNRCKEIASVLISKIIGRVEGRGVFPFSVDFMLDDNEPIFLELHYPSRGFEVLYAPFRPLTENAIFPIDIYSQAIRLLTEEAHIHKIVLAHSDSLTSDIGRSRSATYGFEFQRLVDALFSVLKDTQLIVCKDWRDASRVDGRIQIEGDSPDLIILDDMDPQNLLQTIFPQQLLPNAKLIQLANDIKGVLDICSQLSIHTPPFRIVHMCDSCSIQGLREELGQLVITKELFHLPSWHAEKRRGVFLDLDDSVDREFLKKSSRNRHLLVQSVVRTSQDKYGHSGELRIHCCGIR
ncbi:MAG: restriction endonuclease [candidate division Zixibacteria bacterium]